jgi:hypothetical protein
MFALYIWPILAGVLGAVVGGYFVVISINRWQKPQLIISLADNRYDGQAPAHYVHLEVHNKKTRRHKWIGGGTALNCKCTITVNGRQFVTKWASREPWGTRVAFNTPSGIRVAGVPDQQHIDQAKLEIINPGEMKRVDVAVRSKGDSNCYIHTPENFLELETYPKGPEANRLPPGEFAATAVIECDAFRAPNFNFTIMNGEGPDAGLLRLQQ